MQCRALTTCVLWEISMQNLQPIIDWRKEVADILVCFCIPLHANLSMTNLSMTQSSDLSYTCS